jgi:exonuclease III
MKIMFWNIRGFGRLARRRQIREYIREEGVDGVGLQETIKSEFTQKDLSEIDPGHHFTWVWKGANGHSRGILMGIKEDNYEMEDAEKGEFYISMVLRHRLTNHRWELLTVYGLAQHNLLADFIAELSRKCMFATLPVVIGGDFNQIKMGSEKNNININQALIDKFNVFIDLHQLQEITRGGPKFT